MTCLLLPGHQLCSSGAGTLSFCWTELHLSLTYSPPVGPLDLQLLLKKTEPMPTHTLPETGQPTKDQQGKTAMSSDDSYQALCHQGGVVPEKPSLPPSFVLGIYSARILLRKMSLFPFLICTLIAMWQILSECLAMLMTFNP